MAKKRRSRQFKESSKIIDMDEARRARRERRSAAKEAEESERTASYERKIRRKRALRKKQARRRIVVAIVAIGLVIVLCASVVNIVKLKKEQHDVKAKQEQLKEEQEQLEKELGNINDDESIEDKAREKLKLVKPGETIYIPEESE